MRYLIGVIIILGMLVVVLLGAEVRHTIKENGRMLDSLKQCDTVLRAHQRSVATLESALEQQGWALDEAVRDLNNCLTESCEYEIRGSTLWYRIGSGEWHRVGDPDRMLMCGP